ncbi:MAG: hypothetical protein ACM33T_16585 [Solirubrobacterales bacterium]
MIVAVAADDSILRTAENVIRAVAEIIMGKAGLENRIVFAMTIEHVIGIAVTGPTGLVGTDIVVAVGSPVQRCHLSFTPSGLLVGQVLLYC